MVLQQVHSKSSEDDDHGVEPSSIFRSFESVAVVCVAAEPGPVDHLFFCYCGDGVKVAPGVRASQHCDGVKVVLGVVRRSTATQGSSSALHNFKIPAATVSRFARSKACSRFKTGHSRSPKGHRAHCQRSHHFALRESIDIMQRAPEPKAGGARDSLTAPRSLVEERKTIQVTLKAGFARGSFLQPRRRSPERFGRDHVHDHTRDDARRFYRSS